MTAIRTDHIDVTETTDHDIAPETGLFVREFARIDTDTGDTLPPLFAVLFASDGEYAGSISDGSDVTFESLAEAEACLRRLAGR